MDNIVPTGPGRTQPERSRAPSPGTARSEASSKTSSPSETTKSQIDFQFLNFSHPSEAKASRARRTVRSHVTRQQHQREQQQRRAKSDPQPPEQLSEPEQQPARAHAATFPSQRPISSELLGLAPASSSPEASSPSPSPTASPVHPQDRRIDPLEIYPPEWHPYIPRIIEHYERTLGVNIPYLDGPEERGLLRTRFFPLVMTDPALLHALMLMAASHYGQTRGTRSHTVDLLQLRGMAIGAINEALSDPMRATSDQLIAAVAKMASYEALFGDRSICNTHMTGLLRMVSLRGGLPALGLDGLLERLLLWIDSNAAHVTNSHIYFDKAAFPSNYNHPAPDPRSFMGMSTMEG